LDFCDELLAALGAPEWHGRSVDALIDSVIVGSINAVMPPYRVEVSGLDQSAVAAAEALREAFEAFASMGANVKIAPDRATLEVAHSQTGF
jgi:hypothetical protein